VKQTLHLGTSREPRPFSEHFLEQLWSLRGR
jgi:hypothetical protein